MLGKLMKYEIKSMYKNFLILYALILVSGVMTFISVNTENSIFSNIEGFVIFVFVMSCGALGVVLIMFTIKRFNASLLGDEGYLMFTLPTSTHTIIWSKALALLIFNIVSVVVFGIVICIVMMGTSGTVSKIDPRALEVIKYVFSNKDIYIGIVISILSIVVSILGFTFLISASLSFGQLPSFKNHKNIYALVFFIVFNVLSTYIFFVFGVDLFNYALVNNIFVNTNISIDSTTSVLDLARNINMAVGNLNTLQFISIIFSILEMGVLYFITFYILDNKLNLD